MASKNNDIVFAIPSKGSLYEGTLSFLRLAGLPVSYGAERQYMARLGGIEGISVLLQRAEEVPGKVASGAADLGLTGEDIFREQVDHTGEVLLVRSDLGYGHARLVVAVPNTWIDVSSIEELADLAISFRLKHHRNLRVATKFPRLVREFLGRHSIVNYALVESLGATESAPASGAADLVIDLTSSGKTLMENHLKVIKGGTVISSQACLIASIRIESWDQTKTERLEAFLDMIESYLRGRDTYNVQATVHRSRLEELAEQNRQWRLAYSVPADEKSSGEGESSLVIRLTCPREQLHQLIRVLRASGAEEVVVTQPDYVFLGHSESFQNLERMLKKGTDVEKADSMVTRD
jgi:ATP phosphoribosyltransferase